MAARKAFDGDSVADIMGAIVKTEPRWESLPETTPGRIRELLRRCVQKDSCRRLRDMGEAWVAIDKALTDSSGISPAVVPGLGEERRARIWKRRALVAMAVALVATGVDLRSLWVTPVRPITRMVIPLPPGDKLALGLMAPLALSPEGELRLGKPRLLFERRSVYSDYDVMPDGRSFVVLDDSLSEPAPTQLILVQNWAEELKRLVPTN